jgi:hypothetical protein
MSAQVKHQVEVRARVDSTAITSSSTGEEGTNFQTRLQRQHPSG